ncbi:condensation domain-containing protein [Kutzneria buriramensis]|uniref:Condensation domain-containing protein n=1 Tax=Kutzneria buriramensis TaxID=1045776 RepID=A0A3E0H1N3_9PSEU|nr:condensation domain-containing protein [Kutzneria buriramensis]REH35678.1 condensation domain-containing protein [Kutzneria buriramensis]
MDTAPVTYVQQADMDGDSRVWQSFDLRGELDVEALVAALESVVTRHDALRLRLLPGEPPRQHAVDESARIELQQVECDSEAEFLDHVEARLVEELDTRWDLADGPPARFLLCRFTPEHHVLCAVFARFAVDGRGQRLFAAELWAAYADLRAGGTPPTEPATGFLAAATRSMASLGRRAVANAAYWRKALAPDPAFAALGELQRRSGDSVVRDFFLAGSARRALAQDADRLRCTEFEVLLARIGDAVADVLDLSRLIILTLNDFRTVDDRDVIGSFARGVPIVLDRDAVAGISPQQVQRTLLRGRVHGYVPPDAMADCQQELARAHGLSVPGTISFSYLDHTAVAAETARVAGLAIGRGPGVPAGSLAAPMLDVVATGQEGGIHLRTVINTGMFPTDRTVAALAAALDARTLAPAGPIGG